MPWAGLRKKLSAMLCSWHPVERSNSIIFLLTYRTYYYYEFFSAPTVISWHSPNSFARLTLGGFIVTNLFLKCRQRGSETLLSLNITSLVAAFALKISEYIFAWCQRINTVTETWGTPNNSLKNKLVDRFIWYNRYIGLDWNVHERSDTTKFSINVCPYFPESALVPNTGYNAQ